MTLPENQTNVMVLLFSLGPLCVLNINIFILLLVQQTKA